MKPKPPEHALEFLLDFDGRRHFYEGGYFAKFEIRRVAKTKTRPAERSETLNYQVQSHAALRKEMLAVARGEKRAPKNAAVTSFESVSALLRLLTPDNRSLLATIRDKKPESVAALARLCGRAQPNVLRTLAKLEAVGFVRYKLVKNRKVPTTSVSSFTIKIDPFSTNDRFERAT